MFDYELHEVFVSGVGLDSYFSLLSYFYSIICTGVMSLECDRWLGFRGIVKFVPSLEVLQYVGDKEHRHNLRWTLYEYVKEQSSSYNVSYNFGRSTASGPGTLGGEWLCKGVRDLKKKKNEFHIQIFFLLKFELVCHIRYF